MTCCAWCDRQALERVRELHTGRHWCFDPDRPVRSVYEADDSDPCPTYRVLKQDPQPLDVTCPVCGAPAGEPCRTPGGDERVPHVGRIARAGGV